jgi:hypothetical protein
MICRLLFFRFCVFVWPLCFLYVDLRPLITPFVSLRFSLNNTVLPAICDGWHFIHMRKALHGLIISLKGEVRAGIYSIVFGYIYFIDVKWLEHWTISTDTIWKVFRLELKDILIQQQFVFIGKDWTISISDDIRVNNYTNCETNGAGSTDLFRIFELTTVVYGVRVSPSSFFCAFKNESLAPLRWVQHSIYMKQHSNKHT